MNAVYLQKPLTMPLPQVTTTLHAESHCENQDYSGFILATNHFQVDFDVMSSLSNSHQGDLLWLTFQSVVDAFQYHRWREGELMRSLVYGCFAEERTWESIAGKPDAWESQVLFSQEALSSALSSADDDEKPSIQQMWQSERLKEGEVEPALDARETCRTIGDYYGLPGWE